MKIELPEQVRFVLSKLNAGGYEANIVGGCVRDSILGLTPKDWDITTSALPQETEQVLSDCKLIETGLKHGTVTALIDSMPLEITTYRIDGAYSDNRHPDSVTFTRSLKEDLARRDFTVNALAYHEKDGIIDYFGGQKDIENKQIRCVGEPDKRFDEDGLRILRALRFAAVLDFEIDSLTVQSIMEKKELLHNIAAERISSEFQKLICGKNAEQILRQYPTVFGEFLPEILPMVGFEQHNPYHIYDVWEHTIHSVSAIEPTPALRLAMLLHDIGKPDCYTQDDKGIGHFYGHPQRGSEIATAVLKRLRLDNATIKQITTLVKYHDMSLTSTAKWIKKCLNKLGEPTFRQLLLVQAADTKAHAPQAFDYLQDLDNMGSILNDVIEQGQCFSLKDLAVNGSDLIKIGITEGTQIGTVLKQLLAAVLKETCPNEKNALLKLAEHLSSIN
ncbi:MAG TPA: HD domain-containing protein [Oscillospiraceae bacterium]|nr:HD domain-containing protein [Oscillospiraceae bacterium]